MGLCLRLDKKQRCKSGARGSVKDAESICSSASVEIPVEIPVWIAYTPGPFPPVEVAV